MNEATRIARKRTFVSPQKTQISITSFSRRKKQNNCTTPERSALTRSFNSTIALGPKVNSPPAQNKLSNNPLQPLAKVDNEEEEMTNTSSESNQSKPSITETETTSTSTLESCSTTSSPEKKGLSRKALHALRKIRSARKVLMDTSLREELDRLMGEGSAVHLVQELGGDPVENSGTSKIDEEEQEESEVEDENPEANSSAREMEVDTEEVSKTPHLTPDSIQIGKETQESPQDKSIGPAKNVSFVEVVSGGSNNSHSLRQGKTRHPYVRQVQVSRPSVESGILYPQSPLQAPVRVDKTVILKKGNIRSHIHRYTLRFKTIASKSEEESHQIIIDTLQKFLATLLQAEPKTIIPPYLDLDRNDKSVQDISAAFPVSSIDLIHMLKKYFFRLSPRNEAGMNWCSVILAQPVPFSIFMEKARYSLENSNFSLWPKASDNENATDIGWLLYSTRNQDEERLTALLSKVTGENIGVK
jgi:hypothetical protein